MDSTLLLKLAIVAAIVIGSGGSFFIVKKMGLSFVNIALSVVSFVKSTLENAGWVNSEGKFDDVLDLIIQALTYVQAICATDATTETKTEKAIEYIKNIASQLGITFSDTEITIITAVLNVGFVFLNALGVKVTMKNYTKVYKQIARHTKPRAELRKVGLGKMY